MLKRCPLAVSVATLILSAAVVADAWASCNSIPDAESAGIGAFAVLVEQDAATAVPTSETGQIGFKGALGRIDRIQLLPGQTAGFRVQPDGQCIQATKDRLIVRGAPRAWADGGRDPSNPPVVSLVTPPAHDGSIQALVLGSQEVCETLANAKQRGAGEPGVALRCEPLPPQLEPRVGGGFNVRVRLPADGKLLGQAGTPLRGPVAVALTTGLRSRAEHDALLSAIATDGCAAHCGELMETGASACIDQFYAVLPGDVAVLDPVPCAVTIPSYIAKNDFKEKCENLSSAGDLEKCDDDRSVLQLFEDPCGGVHIPFDWKQIRKDNSTTPPTDITRIVAGRSATARTEKGKLSSSRIWIPGREFLGSTPWADPQGTAATIDWRKPEIDVWYPADSPEEVGLRGSVDQPDSIVHIFPRMPVSLACTSGSTVEACMGVEGGGGISCACRDRYPADCTCAMLTPPLFFACDGGDYDAMPCTRHAHCNSAPGSGNPSGMCSAQPTCQKDDKTGVWESPGPSNGTACWVDDTCKQVANRPWCGKRLFDVGDRKNALPKPELIELDAKIDSGATGARERRGACRESRTNACNHEGANACSVGECRGYTLRAEGQKP